MKENYVCPICGARVNDIEAHMLQMHPEEIARQEKEMLDEMARQQKEAMHLMRDMHPGIYEEFLKELAKEDNREIKMICAREYLAMNDFEKAGSIYMDLIERGEGDAEAYAGLGICKRREGKNEEAMEFFMEAVRRGDLDVALANICDIYEEEGRFAEEKEFLSGLLKEHDTGYLHALYARILTMIGKLEEAEKEAKKAIEMGEEDGYIYLAFSLILRKKEEEAEAILQEYNEKHPDKLHSYILLANIYMERDAEKAEKYLDILLQKADEPEVMDYLIQSFLNLGKMEKAEEVARKAIRMYNMPQYHLIYGLLLLMKGEDEEKEFIKFLDAFPSRDSYMRIIEIYIDAEKYDKAWKYLKKAEINFGGDSILKYMRGNILLAEGNVDEAMEAYESSLREKKNVNAYVGLIKCYLRRGEGSKALDACKEAIEITDDEDLRRELEQLMATLGG